MCPRFMKEKYSMLTTLTVRNDESCRTYFHRRETSLNSFRNENGVSSSRLVLHFAQTSRKKGQYSQAITVRYTTITFTTFYETMHQTSWSTWPTAFLYLVQTASLTQHQKCWRPYMPMHLESSCTKFCESDCRRMLLQVVVEHKVNQHKPSWKHTVLPSTMLHLMVGCC